MKAAVLNAKRMLSNPRLQQQQQQQTRLFDICRQHGLEDIRTKGYCCFNHICGLPAKQGLEKPSSFY
jgi:hypothetical protein